MIYVASPYSDRSDAVRTRRFEQVRGFVAYQLTRPGQRFPIFSPIVYAHELAEDYGIRTDAQTWSQFNAGMLRLAHEMWVLQLDGWENSLGVKAELAMAQMCKITIRHFEENGVEVL